MFHHVVMLSLKAPLQQSDLDYIVAECEALRRLPGVIRLDFVENVSDRSPSYTHAFTAVFTDSAAHDNYQETPLHVPLREKVQALTDHVIVLDYETLA